MKNTGLLFLFGAMLCACQQRNLSNSKPANLSQKQFSLYEYLMANGLSPWLNDSSLNIEIIYTRIYPGNTGPTFKTYSYNPQHQYHYPASTVKLPVAVLALEYLNEHKSNGINASTTMLTRGVRAGEPDYLTDPTAADKRPTIAHYIKQILLVSDNEAFNRLYELLGQEYINSRLHQLGFPETEIIHRLNISLSETENRTANPVEFVDADGKPLHTLPKRISTYRYATRNDFVGKGYQRNGETVPEPLNFSIKNRWPLAYHHQLVQWLMFPQSQPAGKKLKLSKADYDFLQQYMSMLPGESTDPVYPAAEYWPTYVKFLLYGSRKDAMIPTNIKIYNKVGDAYGFLIDGAYLKDEETGIEFLLSARIYCNADGILNDDRYDYDSIGFPFMQKLGEIIYAYEKERRGYK